jgi:uncharacterized protein with GYD domain
MKTYLTLLTYTDQGLRGLKDSSARAAEWKRKAESAGVEVVAQLWTAGAYDGALVLRGPSEETVLSLVAQLAAQGNVRTHSLRAFDAAEFAAVTKG